MLPDFHERPGLLFVAATLLPLASFLIIFLACGAWAMLRKYRDNEAGENLYNLFGGEAGGRGAAYIALAAIAGSCVLSVTGFVLFLHDEHTWEDTLHEQHEKVEELKAKEHAEFKDEEKEALAKELAQEEKELKGLETGRAAAYDARWKGRWDWLRVAPAGLSDPGRGTVLQVGFKIDTLCGLMFVMVTFVATLIHLFSIGYMSEELGDHVADHHVHTEDGHLHRRGRFGRFFLFLSLFCFSMLNLVLADNLFQVFVSWELVGICSYLLIGFFFERQSAANASNKAFITNRIGDAGFIIGLLIIWSFVGSFNFEEIFKKIRCPETDSHGEKVASAGQIVRASPLPDEPGKLNANPDGSEVVLFPLTPTDHFHPAEYGDKVIVDPKLQQENPSKERYSSMPYWMLVVAGLGIFLGCVGKSAQVPLQVWLPDAMEGPTPVSALIHAATMVAAGVYLVGRVFPLFTPEALITIAYTGAITLFVAASIAVVMTDIKKVLAYSTVSQLGLMMLALGVGGWAAGLFHLMTHACFKALLFLGSGSVIYGCHHEQDMLKMGGLYKKMKITALTMLMGCLAIAGIPGFSGWYSKDAVLASALGFALAHPKHLLLFLLPLGTAGITTFYMFRMWFMTFTGEARDQHVHEHAHETPWPITTPLVLLGILSVCVAWGWPFFSSHIPFLDAETSWLEKQIHHSQPASVEADFGPSAHAAAVEHAAANHKETVLQLAHTNHALAGNLALGVVALGLLFASLLYYSKVLDPSEAKEQFAGVHDFLTHKWYFDELYSAVLVRPALVVAYWFKAFDLTVIDGVLHAVARGTVRVAKWDGMFDNGVIDGLVNVTANAIHGVGAWLRNVQTGYLRNYVLFLVLAAVGLFMLLTYFVSLVAAG